MKYLGFPLPIEIGSSDEPMGRTRWLLFLDHRRSIALGPSLSLIEQIVADKPGGDPIDERELPVNRTRLSAAVLAEIQRLEAETMDSAQARRLAACYVALARFQPGVAANSALLQATFTPGGPDIMQGLNAFGHRDAALKKRAESERARGFEYLGRLGYGHLLERESA
jgi:hypothetical protein